MRGMRILRLEIEFHDVFYVDYVAPSKKSHQTNRDLSFKVLGIISFMIAVMQKIERLLMKVD